MDDVFCQKAVGISSVVESRAAVMVSYHQITDEVKRQMKQISIYFFALLVNFTYLILKSTCCSMTKGFNVTCLLYKYEHVFVLSYAETPSSSLMTSTGLCSHGRCAPKSSNRSTSLTASITAVTPSLFGTFTSSPSVWSWHVQTHTNTNTGGKILN